MKKPIRILIVEDEIITAMCLEMELKRAGFVVLSKIATGEEAVKFTIENRPDAIFMDIHLAGEIDGVVAAQQIGAVIQQIPIIFMTAYPDQETEARVKQLNPLAFCIKPLDILQLKPLIELSVTASA